MKNQAFKLSPSQQRIVEHRGGHLQVIACAGSGKTESVSRRIAALINEGAEPDSIVAFTFTEKAATELKDRIYKRVEEIKGKEYLGLLGPMFVGTIHSYCFRVLQDHVPKYGNYDVLDEHRHAAFISRRRHGLGLDKLHHQHWKSIEQFIRALNVIENELIQPSDLDGTEVGDCFAAYQDLINRYRLLTFGSIISRTVHVLENDPEIYERVQGPLRHLIVDEYQDINPAQERLIELLAKAPVHLCVVGDDDQAIYQWRGSDVGNILKFTDRYKEAKTIKLQTNRRSRPMIVDMGNAFAQSIPDRLPKAMNSTRAPIPPGIFPWLAETAEDEAEVIAEHITKLKSEGWRYQDMAVMFRSVRTSAPPLVEALSVRGIPFNCGGRTGLFAHPEINYFGELFSWMAGFSWKDARFGPSREASLDVAVTGLTHSFGLSKDEAAELKTYFQHWKSWHSKGSHRVSLVGDFYKHLQVLGIESVDPDDSSGSARLGALARFSMILADYENVTLRSRWTTNEEGEVQFRSGTDRGKAFWTGLANYLLHYAKESYEDFEGETIHNLDAVSILTVHQAKGLEWPIVFLPALTNKRFPSSMSGRRQDWAVPEGVFPEDKRSRYEGSDADERRLFYVALTRARDVAYVSSFERITRAVGLSPYLIEIIDELSVSPIPKVDELHSLGPPAELKSPDKDPLELGYSDLADYEDCGYMYRLSRVFGFQPELVPELGYGRAVHHVLRLLAELATKDGKLPSTEELKALINHELYVPFANESTFANMLRSVQRLVNSYVKDWPDDLSRIWATERPFEIHLGEGILAGRADVILDEESGRIDHLAIVDYKTATDEHRDARYDQQLRVYAAAGLQEGINVDACYVHELKSSGRKEVDIGPDKLAETVNWAIERVKEVASGSYPQRPEDVKCERCDFRQVCRHSCVVD